MDVIQKGKLFIGGLSWDTTNDGLRNYFSKYGEVIDAVIMKDRVSNRSRGFGFITFHDDATAEAVALETHIIDGRTIEAKTAVSREEMAVRGFKTRKIFVGGLSISTTEEEFKQYFEQFGSVMDAQIMLERDTGRPRGFGFITFEKEESVEKALLHAHEIGGKAIDVKKAQPKTAFLPSFSPFRSFGYRGQGTGSGSSGSGSSASLGGGSSNSYSGDSFYSSPLSQLSAPFMNSQSSLYSALRSAELYSNLGGGNAASLFSNRTNLALGGGHYRSGFNNSYNDSNGGNFGFGYPFEMANFLGGGGGPHHPLSPNSGGGGGSAYQNSRYSSSSGGNFGGNNYRDYPLPSSSSYRPSRHDRQFHPYRMKEPPRGRFWNEP